MCVAQEPEGEAKAVGVSNHNRLRKVLLGFRWVTMWAVGLNPANCTRMYCSHIKPWSKRQLRSFLLTCLSAIWPVSMWSVLWERIQASTSCCGSKLPESRALVESILKPLCVQRGSLGKYYTCRVVWLLAPLKNVTGYFKDSPSSSLQNEQRVIAKSNQDQSCLVAGLRRPVCGTHPEVSLDPASWAAHCFRATLKDRKLENTITNPIWALGN